MRRFISFVSKRPMALASFLVIAVLYLGMAFAEALAPHPHTRMFPEYTFHPPNARIVGGRLVAQEWIVTNTVTWSYARIAGQFHPVRFFHPGADGYRLWQAIPATRRVMTTGEGAYPLFLMGADHMGRDVFSRIVMGARVSLS
ncbi:MAG: dipeptide/oligopeptide/nickel ABC transporter ATP-binding protein, partial [Treponema sp.]|nr:dipeptide/oligopeptide/nickel ABC transporter ATP-binding protein [Treponema sp.]